MMIGANGGYINNLAPGGYIDGEPPYNKHGLNPTAEDFLPLPGSIKLPSPDYGYEKEIINGLEPLNSAFDVNGKLKYESYIPGGNFAPTFNEAEDENRMEEELNMAKRKIEGKGMYDYDDDNYDDDGVTAPEDVDLSPSLGEEALGLAPVGYNLAMGLSPAVEIDADRYLDRSNISKGEFDMNPYLQSFGESYAASLNSLKGSGAGNYYANVRGLQNARNKDLGRVHDAKRTFDEAEQKEFEKRTSEQDRYNSNVELSIDDINKKAKAAKRAFLGEAAVQGADLAARKGDTRTTLAYLNAAFPDMASRFKYETTMDKFKNRKKNKKGK